MHRSFIVRLCLPVVALSGAQAQDTTWQQVLGGWVDDVYYENLFLGGTYYTRISLADIDGDGDLDMFYGGGNCGSLVYFENVGDAYEPSFELRFEEFPGLMNAPSVYGGTVDVDFADLDDDGDLDAAYSAYIDAGGAISWNDGTPQEPDFGFRQPSGPGQGQSNVTLLDIDNDGDYDYFSGQGYGDDQMYFAENVGTSQEPLFEHRTYNYQDLDFGVPFNFDFGDIDGDEDFDLLVCKHGGNIAYYENTGTPEEANFILITGDYLPDRDTTDWLETPELADIDDDGDLDLFLAGGWAHLFYFENIGSPEDPRFVQRSDTSYFYVIPHIGGAWLGNSVDIDGDGDDDLAPGASLFLNESSYDQIRFSRDDNTLPFVSGAFADLDADGDYDYVIPGGAATIGYHENIGDSTWPVWDSRRDLFPADGRLYYVYTVTAGDLDGDGDFDLLVGHENSQRPLYYRNDGSPQTYNFVYAGMLNLPQWQYRATFEILLGDIDNDRDLDLLVGEVRIDIINPLRLMFYRNDGTLSEPSWTFVSDDFQNVVSDHRNGSIAPCLADVDNDGDKDLVMTNNSIGMQLFLNPLFQTRVEKNHDNELQALPLISQLSCYPNPFNSTAKITVTVTQPSDIDVSVYNLLGQRVASILTGHIPEGTHRFDWEPEHLAAGVYFLRASAGEYSRSVKILYLK